MVAFGGVGAAFKSGDWNAMRDICAPDVVFEDRRRLVLVLAAWS